MRGRRSRLAAVVGVCLAGTAVSLWALPWTTQMVSGGAVLPGRRMLTPPAGTRALGQPRVLDLFDAEEQLENPRPASEAVVAEGAALFATYCAACHGASGRNATGTVGRHFRMVPDLSDPAIQEYRDGILYTVIREGGFNMPGYAEALSASERWAVVRFVRTLRR